MTRASGLATASFGVEAEEMEVFAHRRHEVAIHALELEAQHHDDIGVGEALAHVVEDLDAEALDAGGQECRRADDPDACAQGIEQQNVGAGDAAVRDVAADGDRSARRSVPCGDGW